MNRLLCIALIFMLSCGKQPQLPDPLEAGWEGQKVCEVIQENEAIRVLKCTFPPNVGHEKHYHAPHVGYTLKGAKFKIEDEKSIREVNVKTGYSWESLEISEHAVLNVGDTTGIFLIIEHKN